MNTLLQLQRSAQIFMLQVRCVLKDGRYKTCKHELYLIQGLGLLKLLPDPLYLFFQGLYNFSPGCLGNSPALCPHLLQRGCMPVTDTTPCNAAQHSTAQVLHRMVHQSIAALRQIMQSCYALIRCMCQRSIATPALHDAYKPMVLCACS